MRQQKDGLFFQSQLYVQELCDPLNILEFLDDQKNLSISHSIKPEKLERSNKSNKNENSTKSRHQLEIKQNPYGSEWANKVLEKQFGVHISQIQSMIKRPKWIIKKLKPAESNNNKEKQNSRLINDIKTQERIYRQPVSKSNSRGLEKIVKNYRLYLLLISIAYTNWINMIIFNELWKESQNSICFHQIFHIIYVIFIYKQILFFWIIKQHKEINPFKKYDVYINQKDQENDLLNAIIQIQHQVEFTNQNTIDIIDQYKNFLKSNLENEFLRLDFEEYYHPINNVLTSRQISAQIELLYNNFLAFSIIQ